MADRVNELKQHELDLKNELRALLTLKSEGEPLSAEQTKRMQHLERELPKAEQATLEERKRLAAEDAELARNPSGRLGPGYGAALPTDARGTFSRAMSDLYGGGPRRIESSAYGELLRATLAGDFHSTVFARQSETVSSEGGFSVSPEFSQRWWEMSLEDSVALAWFRVEPMASSEKIVPMLDDFDRSGGKVAGAGAEWAPEGVELTVATAKLDKIHLHAAKTAILVEISRELLDDAGGRDVAMEFERAMRGAITLRVDKAILATGTGVGQPQSILGSSALIAVTKQVGQPGGSLVYENLLAMVSRLPAESQARFIWIASPSTVPSLYKLSFTVGTGGVAPPVFTQANDGSFRLFGRPMVFSPRLPSLGTVGDVLAVDPGQYVIGLRSAIQLARSEHVAFSRDAVVLRALLRLDGQPAWRKPRKDEDGTERSPFVAVETRS